MPTQTPRLAESAYARALNGEMIFPLWPDTKEPLGELVRTGFKEASCDPELVRIWWQVYPEANIGLATGTVYDVLDIDNHPGGSGYDAYRRLRDNGLISPPTHVVRTPSGGMHAYYPADPEQPQPSWSLTDHHIDFRGTGGYIVLPPSKLADSGQYVTIASHQASTPIDAGRVRDWLAPPTPPRPATPLVLPEHRDAFVSRITGWLAKQHTGRNNALFWAARQFRDHDLDENVAHAHLTPISAHAGLTPRAINATISSAYRHRRSPPISGTGPAARPTAHALQALLKKSSSPRLLEGER